METRGYFPKLSEGGYALGNLTNAYFYQVHFNFIKFFSKTGCHN
jgi:hypothetical protein